MPLLDYLDWWKTLAARGNDGRSGGMNAVLRPRRCFIRGYPWLNHLFGSAGKDQRLALK
jgi:hypothetical protein